MIIFLQWPNCLNPANPCATLGHAVSAASDGDIIHLAVGTYSAAGLVIEKNVILQGEGVVVE